MTTPTQNPAPVSLTAKQWGLFSKMTGAEQVAAFLSEQLTIALQKPTAGEGWQLFETAMIQWSLFGANHSEPRAIALSHFRRVFGEAAYQQMIIAGRVSLTSEQWWLFSEMPGAEAVAAFLSEQLTIALQKPTAGEGWQFFEPSLTKWKDFGAADSEPRAVALSHFRRVYGEAAYQQLAAL